MGEKEFALELSELAELAFRCRCGTSMTFQAEGKNDKAVKITCPGCGHPYSQIHVALNAYRSFREAANIEGLEARITIRASALGGQPKS